ncbi:glycosyltransferase family 2 protein [Agrobacterium tumefaciens]|nr:glycosyltransferase family 2 protein [Agrobacterium tumefaciens]NTE18915.1 glycosyltransferase family 2 protein [Agrobacterium tumefaciens]
MVSVIIPNYNHHQYLQLRIQSVLDQTFQNYEIIILDDCSTDNSRSIIESFRNNIKIRHIVYNEQNSGSTFSQWSKGIQLAVGEIIWIAESDDYAEPTFLDKLIPLFDEPQVNLAFAQSYRVNELNEITDNCLSWFSKEFHKAFKISGREFIKNYLWENNQIYNASSVLFRKTAYPTDVNKLNELKFVGDWMAYLKIICDGQLAYIPDVLNYFRESSHSVTKKYLNSVLHVEERLKIAKYIVANKLYPNSTKLNTLLNYLAGLLIYSQIKKSDFWRLTRYAMKSDPLILVRLAYLKCVKMFRKE